MTPTPAEHSLRLGLLQLVDVLSFQLARNVPTARVLDRLDFELGHLGPVIAAVRREDASAWLVQQEREARPKRTRNTAARRQRALLAEIAAGQS